MRFALYGVSQEGASCTTAVFVCTDGLAVSFQISMSDFPHGDFGPSGISRGIARGAIGVLYMDLYGQK